MQITCKCLNVIINSKGSEINSYDIKSNGSSLDHSFFKENIGSVELESIHKEQSSLVDVEAVGQWVIHRCLNCGLHTHALNTTSTAIVLVNRALLTKPEEITALKNSDKYSPIFHIVIDHEDEEETIPVSGVRNIPGSAGLHQQLTEWIQRESSLTEERVRQYSEQQYSALDRLRTRAHRDHLALTKTLLEASTAQKSDAKKPLSQFSVTNKQPVSPQKAMPILPDPTSAIKHPVPQVVNRPRNLARKPSVDAEGLFDLDGMDEAVEAFPSDEELTDTDESGSHDEGIHIPRHVNSIYAKSLPVDVPTFAEHMGLEESPQRPEYRVAQEPMDIAASIKALARSVHGDAVFGDLPRPRFSSQI